MGRIQQWSSDNQWMSHQSPRLATFSVIGNERWSYLIIPGFMISGDSRLSALLGLAAQLYARGFRCGRPMSACCARLTSLIAAAISWIRLRGFAVNTGTVLAMGPSRCIWEGESVIGTSQLLKSDELQRQGPRKSLWMTLGSGTSRSTT